MLIIYVMLKLGFANIGSGTKSGFDASTILPSAIMRDMSLGVFSMKWQYAVPYLENEVLYICSSERTFVSQIGIPPEHLSSMR